MVGPYRVDMLSISEVMSGKSYEGKESYNLTMEGEKQTLNQPILELPMLTWYLWDIVILLGAALTNQIWWHANSKFSRAQARVTSVKEGERSSTAVKRNEIKLKSLRTRYKVECF